MVAEEEGRVREGRGGEEGREVEVGRAGKAFVHWDLAVVVGAIGGAEDWGAAEILRRAAGVDGRARPAAVDEVIAAASNCGPRSSGRGKFRRSQASCSPRLWRVIGGRGNVPCPQTWYLARAVWLDWEDVRRRSAVEIHTLHFANLAG